MENKWKLLLKFPVAQIFSREQDPGFSQLSPFEFQERSQQYYKLDFPSLQPKVNIIKETQIHLYSI